MQYRIVGKLVNTEGKIIGYRLVDEANLSNKVIDVSLKKALQISNFIAGAKPHGNYLRLSNHKTKELPTIVKKGITSTPPTHPISHTFEFKDYSNYKISPLVLGGVADKVIVIDPETDKRIILKFGRSHKITDEIIRDYVSEFIGCRIGKELGYSIQEVHLGYYNGRECVAIDMFDSIPITFKNLGYSTVDNDKIHTRDENYDLDWLLKLRMGAKFGISQSTYTKWVLAVFMLDMFIGNYDRHEGNWGFITNENNKKVPSPLFDMGASLFSRDIDSVIGWTDGKIKNEIESGIRSSILYKGKKRGYFQLLNIYIQTNPQLKEIITSFINLAEQKIDNFRQIYNEVNEYNREYEAYTNFIDKMLRIKLALLRRFN